MYRSHKSKKVSWFRTMVNGFIYLSQGFLILITLGWISPHWDIDYMLYCSKKNIDKNSNV